MSAKYICDGCGKEEPASYYGNGSREVTKPHDWYQRCDSKGYQVACSRDCIETAARKFNVHSIVLPI